MNHSQIHLGAVQAANTHRKSEMELLNALELVWKNKTFSQYGVVRCSNIRQKSSSCMKRWQVS